MKNKKMNSTFKYAFINSIPVMTGYLFLGITYGIYMRVSGFEWYLSLFCGVIIYSGAMQFVSVNLLTSSFNLLNTFFMAIALGARHIFYGISMLSIYKDMKHYKPYSIYAMSDETFSINYSSDVSKVDKNKFYFYISLLDQIYWLIGSILGGIFGNFITFNTTGLDFVMTVMFVVIMLNQLLKEKNHTSSIIGVLCSVISLLIFGSSYFIIPSMILIVLCLFIFKKPIEKSLEKQKNKMDFTPINQDILNKEAV